MKKCTWTVPFVLMLSLSLSCEPAEKQQYSIGIVNPSKGLEKVIEGFKGGMQEYGYFEDRNIKYIYNGPIHDPARLGGEIQGMIDSGVDLLFTITLPPTLKAKEMMGMSRTPVLFAPIYDPVRSEVVTEIGIHGCNFTGVQIGGNTAKALYWLKEISPGVEMVLVPFDTGTRTTALCLWDLKEGARKLGVKLKTVEVRTREELATVLSDQNGSVDAIWLLNSFYLVNNMDLFVAASLERKIPLASATSQYRKGVTISYGQDMARTGEIASGMAHKILKGAKPADLPIETTDFYLGINLKMANSIGLEIPDYILLQADFIAR